MATYTNLDNEIFANSALQAFVKTLAPLAAFSRNFSAAPVQKGNTVLVPLIAALTATTFGGSYAVCGGTKTVVTISIKAFLTKDASLLDSTSALKTTDCNSLLQKSIEAYKVHRGFDE